jgi:hypothetical protein
MIAGMSFKFSEILMAFEHANGGRPGENAALLRKELGQIFYSANFGRISDIIAADREADDAIELPRKKDLSLDQKLAFDFVREFLPPRYIDKAAAIFEEPLAYRKFKGWLKGKAMHHKWFAFEAEARERELRAWCREHEVELED